MGHTLKYGGPRKEQHMTNLNKQKVTLNTVMDIFVYGPESSHGISVQGNKRYLTLPGGYTDEPTMRMSLTEGLRAASEYGLAQHADVTLSNVFAENLTEQVNIGDVYSDRNKATGTYSLMTLLQNTILTDYRITENYKLFYPAGDGSYKWLSPVTEQLTKDEPKGKTRLMALIYRALQTSMPIDEARVQVGDSNEAYKLLLDYVQEIIADSTRGHGLSDMKQPSTSSDPVPLSQKVLDNIKFAFIYKDDPRLGLEWMDTDTLGETFIALIDHDSLEQVNVFEYEQVAEGPFNLDKFYIIPVKGSELTLKEYTDFIFNEGKEAGEAIAEYLQKVPSTDIDEYNK